MRTVLVVGDPHVTADDLPDCDALLDFIYEVQEEEQPHAVLFMGDQHHNHALTHVAVTSFWLDRLYRLGHLGKVWVLLGNHDKPAGGTPLDAPGPHALAPYRLLEGMNVEVIDRPLVDYDLNVCFLPYADHPAEMIEWANRPEFARCGTLFCHQWFDGGRFDNGFYAKDGVDQELLPQAHVVSGHIHLPQSFGRVWHPGAPRWRTLSDANIERAIWAVDLDEQGRIVGRRAYDTGKVCRRIRHVALMGPEIGQTSHSVERLRDEIKQDQKSRWHVDLHGTPECNAEARLALEGLGVKLRTFDVVTAAPRVRESEGIDLSFERWRTAWKSKHGTSPALLERMVSERVVA